MTAKAQPHRIASVPFFPWIFTWILLLSCLSLPLSTSLHAPLQAQEQRQETERGYVPDKIYELGEFDSVNPFNGGLSLHLPLGGDYPVGGGLSYGLTLTYNAMAWEYETECPSEDIQCYLIATPIRDDNAGMGWRVSLGEMRAPFSDSNDTSSWIYVSPDSGDHRFYNTLHQEDSLVTGYSYTRDGSYLRMRELTGGFREVSDPAGTVRTFNGNGELVEIRSPYPSGTVTISPFYLSGDLIRWDISDSTGRTHQVHFTKKLVDGVYVPMVTSVDVAAYAGTRAVYSFHYLQTSVTRPLSSSERLPGLSTTATVQQLTGVTLPDTTTYSFGYESYGGHLNRLTLPTKGRVDYGYTTYSHVALDDPPIALKDPNYEPPDPYDNQTGVGSRKLYNEGGALLGTWTYTQGLDDLNGVSTTTLVDPLGHKRVMEFQNDPMLFDHSLPYTHLVGDGSGRFRSVRTYDASGTLLRTEYVRYEKDTTRTIDIYEDAEHRYNWNRRAASNRTTYHDDGGRFTYQDSSNFDGFGNYRQTVRSGNFGGAKTLLTDYNPARGTYPGTYTSWPTSSPWVLGTFSQSQVTGEGVTTTKQFCFESSTGYLLRRRDQKWASRGANDTVTVFTRDSAGNTTREATYGGDRYSLSTSSALCGLALPASEYRVDHTYQYGALKTSQPKTSSGGSLGFKTVDHDLDSNTALPVRSRDGTGLSTDFEYDTMGRLTWAKPSGGTVARDGWVELAWLPTATTPHVIIRRRANGSKTATILARELVSFDDFGRVEDRRQYLPDGTWSTRRTGYDALGQTIRVSEPFRLGSTIHWSYFQGYDPFGRATRIVAPDGKAVDFDYDGVRRTTRWVHLGTGLSGSTVTETQVATVEVYDGLGRLVTVREDDAGTPHVTDYFYDVGDRLTRVKQVRGTTTQERRFNYDHRGFLLSEQHPEKGTTGAGWVHYYTVDSRGTARRRVDGPNDLTFNLDAAGRVTQVATTGGRVHKSYVYATSNLTANQRAGKLWYATRHNYFDDFGIDLQVTETYTYGGREGRVSGKDTDLSSGDSYYQFFNWNELGDLYSLRYPDCHHCPVGSVPTRTVYHTYTNGFLTSVNGYGTLTYHPNQTVHQVTHPNNVVWTQGKDPDDLQRPASITAQRGTYTLFQTGAYGYDGAGNVVKMGSDTYLYDRYGRLKEGTAYQAGSQRKQTYGYDGFSNLTSITTWTNGSPSTRTFSVTPSSNRLPGPGAQYDGAGAMTVYSGYTYTRDELGMVKDYRNTGATLNMRYAYTVDDERIMSYDAAQGKTVWRLRDLGGRVIRENYDTDTGPHGWTRDYLFAEGRTLASIGAADGTRYYHPDHLGNTRAMSNASGNLAALNHFYPFGESAYAWNPYGQPLRFTGHERDDNLSGTLDDLDYMHARFYSPHLGRFMRVDPAAASFNSQNPQSWNRYSYVLNSPMQYTDPTGEVLDWAIDAAGIAYSAYEFAQNPSWKTGGTLALDVVLGAVPFVPNTGAVKLAAKGAGAAIDAGKAAAKGADVTNGAENVVTGINLQKQLANSEQVGELVEGGGKRIAGSGAEVPLRDVNRLVSEYGGVETDWTKITSSNFRASDGTSFEVHAYRNEMTGEIVELKTKVFK